MSTLRMPTTKKASWAQSLVWFFVLLLSSISSGQAQTFGVAGTPISTVEDRNYEGVFRALRNSGVDTYFPTFQYQEVPEPLSFGFETDFLPPCTADDPGFRALRSTGMKLIVPGELIYPDPSILTRDAKSEDPLAQIIECAGPDGVAAITNYDEAVLNGRPIQDVAALYEHLKSVAPNLPVLMVHGPIVADRPEFSRPDLIETYLQRVQAFSEFADVVGFDVYPFPAFLMQLATPSSGGMIVEEARVVEEYLTWIGDVLPRKSKLIVLQGFALTDLYDPDFLESNFSADLLATVAAPANGEIQMMVKQAKAHDAEFIFWWGGAALKSADDPPWPSILGAASTR